jgi:Fe-S-cluster containining protein
LQLRIDRSHEARRQASRASFRVDFETATDRYTKIVDGTRALRHQKDAIYGSVCMFLDTKTRRCTIYEARPALCRQFPETKHCGYYDFLRWERNRQDDPEFIPLDYVVNPRQAGLPVLH